MYKGAWVFKKCYLERDKLSSFHTVFRVGISMPIFAYDLRSYDNFMIKYQAHNDDIILIEAVYLYGEIMTSIGDRVICCYEGCNYSSMP